MCVCVFESVWGTVSAIPVYEVKFEIQEQQDKMGVVECVSYESLTGSGSSAFTFAVAVPQRST